MYVCMYVRMYVRMYVCMYICMQYICIIICTCARGGYGRACGFTASYAHVRAISRTDDAAVAVTCAWVRPPVYVANAHVMYKIYVHIYRCKVRVCELVRVCVLAYACDRVRALTMR